MIKPIVKDIEVLSKKAQDADKEDQAVIIDLLDTIKAHQEHCVGMAANMIGICKRIIVFQDEQGYQVMLNPEIIKTSGAMYACEEGCLSLQGVRTTKRYERIKVRYLDAHFKTKIKTYCGYPAQIIQHEIDHCNGILI